MVVVVADVEVSTVLIGHNCGPCFLILFCFFCHILVSVIHSLEVIFVIHILNILLLQLQVPLLITLPPPLLLPGLQPPPLLLQLDQPPMTNLATLSQIPHAVPQFEMTPCLPPQQRDAQRHLAHVALLARLALPQFGTPGAERARQAGMLSAQSERNGFGEVVVALALVESQGG